MGVPLLKDVHETIEQAIIAKEENLSPGSYEKARLRFAHAETVIPFTCLLGLFLEGSEFERIQTEQPLDLPPKPPQRRNWIGSAVAPFAGNNMLVLFHCSGNDSNGVRTSEGSKRNYFVQVLHNEIPVPMPVRLIYTEYVLPAFFPFFMFFTLSVTTRCGHTVSNGLGMCRCRLLIS